MGFNTSDIELAIDETNATSSEDAPKVVEWLGEHEGEAKRRRRSSEGGGLSSSNKSIDSDEEDDDLLTYYDEEEDDFTLHTKRTQTSHATYNTSQTTETEESDEKIQELQDSLRDLGFSKGDIKRGKELYRRHSDKMDAQSFISAMLEVEDEIPIMTPEKEVVESKKNKIKKAPVSAPPSTNAPMRNLSKKDKKSSVDDSTRSITLEELGLVDSIYEMGFEKDQIKNVIDDMHHSGVTKIDADNVLGKLLTGGGGGHDSCSSIPAPKSSVSESSSTFSQSCSALGGNNKDLSATTHASNDTTIGSIEITPGQFAKLLKGRQTWNAMHNGTAVSASCIICTSTLQCCPEADYVLCPDCNVVSPLSSNDDDNHSRGSSSHRDANRQESIRKLSMESDHVGAVGLGYKRS